MTNHRLEALLKAGVPLKSLAFAAMGKQRWAGVSKSRRSAAARKAAAARMEKMSARQRREVARLGGLAKAKAARLRKLKKGQ